jgi:leucyl-tRNA synthetase
MKEDIFPENYAKDFLKMLNPIIPFTTEEIWQRVFNGQSTISYEKWPEYDEEKTKDDMTEIVVQINSKIVARVEINLSDSQENILSFVKSQENIKNLLEGKQIVKEIYVPARLVNLIVK